MIRLPATGTLNAPDRRALDILTDLARLIPVADPTADVVTIDVSERPTRFDTLRDWKAAGWGIAPADGVVHVARAALTLVADVVSATRERQTAARDRFGRVPATENALVNEDLQREPLVSRAAAALRTAAIAAAGRRSVRLAAPWPRGHRWAVALTHDLDVVSWWPAFTALRLAELARKGAWGRGTRVAAAALGAIRRSPAQRGVATLLETERTRGIRSTWFVLCGTPTWRTFLAGDLTYRPEAAGTRRVLAQIEGHAIGLHGSFDTMTASATMAEQRQRLATLAECEVAGVRQHFLRFDLEHTPRVMREAGFTYDSTSGFADRNGFRLGVCDVLPAWDDAGQGTGTPLAEVPFAWMDRALSKYRGVEDPDTWVADALELAHACREVEGLWVGVWHPNLVPALGFPGAPAAYERLLDRLAADHPYFGTLDELVAWRNARARLRIERVAPDGRVDLARATHVPLEEPPR